MEPTELSSGATHEELMLALNVKLLREQNLALGIVAGAGAAIAGAAIWMGITIATQMQFGLVAIAIGAGVGYAVRYAGKGVTKVFGVVGAVCTLLSCIAGEVFTVVQLSANAESIGFFDALAHVDLGSVVQNVVENSSIMTYIIYGIGIYEGYKFSFRKLTLQEIQEARLAPPPPVA
jgi:hypothetical protein